MQLTAHFDVTLNRIYIQAPNAATQKQRQANLAEDGLTERTVAGRTRVFRFDDPRDTRPARLGDNLRRVSDYWQEWNDGLGGCLPAKTYFHEGTDKLSKNDKKKFSMRKPVYLLLESLVRFKKCNPSEAFRRGEKHFPRVRMVQLESEIRKKGPAGQLHEDLRVDHLKWDFQPPNNPRGRKRKGII